jgi:CRISPR-associated protein Csx16
MIRPNMNYWATERQGLRLFATHLPSCFVRRIYDHGTALKEALRAANCPAPRFVRIPMGREPRELWRQFDVIKTELRGGDGPVMLDITHGFRSQPFFAAAVATFVYAVDETPPDLRVLCGA